MKMRNLITVLVLAVMCACNATSTLGSSGDGSNSGGEDNTNGGSSGTTTYSISGQITGASAADVTVTLSGDGTGSATTDEDGNYEFTGLAAGSYTVTPTKANTAFSPTTSLVTMADSDEEANFVSAAYQSVAITSSATKDGTVNQCIDGDFSTDTTGKVGREGSVGDCMGADRLHKTYFHLDLAGAGISAAATIISANLSFKQTVTGAPYSSNSLTISHVNYGDALGTEDWETAPITSQTISNTASSNGIVAISTDLKNYVQSDVSERRRTQFRLSFPDDIAADNYITIERGAGAANPPTLTMTYYQF